MPNRFTILGHPLAAEENRLAFADWKDASLELIIPKTWRSPSLKHVYNAEGPTLNTPGRKVHVLRIAFSGFNSFFFWFGLSRCLRSSRPGVLYCWEEPWCLATLQAALYAKRWGAVLVFYSAENKPKSLLWPFRIMRGYVYRRAGAAIVPTQEIAANLRASGYPGIIRVVPLWIRPRALLAPDPGLKCVAYLGRLISLKRVDLLVKALAKLPGYRLRIIGHGPEMPRLWELVQSLELETRVEFLGHVDNGILESALLGVSLLVLPTGENSRQAEQFGKAALEGVACGLPVLASRTGNLEMLARTIPTLTARNVDSPELMAEAIAAIFAAYPDAAARAHARDSVLQKYGPESAGRALAAAFAELAREGKKS